jgi:hypothetical protein
MKSGRDATRNSRPIFKIAIKPGFMYFFPCGINKMERLRRPCLFLVVLLTLDSADAVRRFAVNGPTLTITVKDPLDFLAAPTSSDTNNEESAVSVGSSSSSSSSSPVPWLDLKDLRPTIAWGIQSLGLPLPNWLPSLKSIQATTEYNYNRHHDHHQDGGWNKYKKHVPSWMVETTAKFGFFVRATQSELSLQQRCSFMTNNNNNNNNAFQNVVSLQLSRGAAASVGAIFFQPTTTTTNGTGWWHSATASFLVQVPAASLSSIRVTPLVDLIQREASCTVEGTLLVSCRSYINIYIYVYV